MAKDSYQALQAQIKKLQEKATAVRNKERIPVISQILRSMEEYEITVEDLRAAQNKTSTPRRASSAAKAVKSARPVPPKYRHPETGDTWSGRGKAPRWLAAAEAEGAKREDFLIDQA
ncbi:MAG: H-NS histone family protein [Pigmentiphaga sp.]